MWIVPLGKGGRRRQVWAASGVSGQKAKRTRVKGEAARRLGTRKKRASEISGKHESASAGEAKGGWDHLWEDRGRNRRRGEGIGTKGYIKELRYGSAMLKKKKKNVLLISGEKIIVIRP